jgi:hypothetical protein
MVMFFMLTPTVFGQNMSNMTMTMTTSMSSINIIVPSTTTMTLPPFSTIEPTIDGNNGNNGNNDNDTQPILCTPGNSVGYMIIRKPNITSMIMVGTQYNVTWDWSITVTKPPNYVDVYIQLIAQDITTTWKRQGAQHVPVNPRWFIWKPDGMVDGKYKLRLVPDGKETYNIAANLQPCFSNGEAIPSVSAAFTVTNSKGDIGTYPDQFPPNKSQRAYYPNFNLIITSYILYVLFMIND